jgi:prepilin-type N-terminal cleavage/methylation domain-containing protein
MRFYLEYIDCLYRRLAGAPRRDSSKGFTLPEVLLASLLMLIAVAIAGNGVVHLLRNNYKANADSELRNNVNRTLEFIGNEVRRAKFIADRRDKIMPLPTGVNRDDVVLAFQIPNPNRPNEPLDKQIVYYVQNRVNPWLGPKVLWRYGPRFDNYGNYEDPTSIGNWELTPMMDLVMDETGNQNRRDCDPLRPGTLSGWERFPSADNQVQGIYSCVKDGGAQVILAANTQITMTDNKAANYALSTKVTTRASDPSFYLSRLSEVATSEPVPDPGPAFTLDTPGVPIVRQPSKVEGSIIGGPPNTCTTGSCTIEVIDTNTLSDETQKPLRSGESTTIPEAKAGQAIIVRVEGVSNYGGTGRNQIVNTYTSADNIPSDLPNVTLTKNQVLIVVTNRRRRPNITYVVLVNIIPRS